MSLDRRTEQIEENINLAPGKRNPHVRGVTQALQILHGLDPTSEDDEWLSDSIHVLDAYAMASSTLCSALPTDGASRRGSPTKVMLANCETHLRATIRALEPQIILTQGKDPAKVVRGLSTEVERLSETVSWVSIGSEPMVLCELSHPAAGPPVSWSSMKPGSYFDETARPSLELARETVIGD